MSTEGLRASDADRDRITEPIHPLSESESAQRR